MNQSSATLPRPETAAEYRAWWEASTDAPYGSCWCGCGERTRLAKQTNYRSKDFCFRGEPVRYLYQHSQLMRTRHSDGAYAVEDCGYVTPCHIWLLNPSQTYARIKRGGEFLFAHRFFYERDVGPIPPGHHLHHACEQKRCVNTLHLVPLTPRDHRRVRRDNKLDAAKVAEIRALLSEEAEHAHIASRYGVCRPTISLIKAGTIWA